MRLRALLGRFARSVGALLGLATAAVAAPANAKTLYFPHRDGHFLYRYQKNGGAAVIPDAPEQTSEPLPLVVFLHGTNSTSETHLWMGGGGKDLRPLVQRLIGKGVVKPFVLAAPSQTKNAFLARTVWQDFDLNLFVDDVARATDGKVTIDRTRVVLAGHSGAGCNPSGGLAADFWSAGAPLPLALMVRKPMR